MTGRQWTFNTIPAEIVVARLRWMERGKNAVPVESLRTLLTEAGCAAPALAARKARGSKLPNLVGGLPGEAEGKLILVSAFFDKVRAGAGAP